MQAYIPLCLTAGLMYRILNYDMRRLNFDAIVRLYLLPVKFPFCTLAGLLLEESAQRKSLSSPTSAPLQGILSHTGEVPAKQQAIS
jgi:hypothetical protein